MTLSRHHTTSLLGTLAVALLVTISICRKESFALTPPKGSVTLLYFNDAHELAPVRTDMGAIGGVSRMKTVIDSIKRETPDALVLFGGDLGGGTLGGKLFRGTVMVETLNSFPVDLATFGQHDFDYGIENTLSLITRSHFTWLSSNISDRRGRPLPGVPLIARKEAGGLKVGFIGLTDKLDTSGGKEDFLQNDLLLSAQKAVNNLGDVDLVIALTQTDMETNERLVREVPGIAVVLTEETSQYKSRVDYLDDVPIVSGCGNMGQLISVTLRVGAKASVSSYPITSTITPNPQMEEYKREKEAEAKGMITKKIGTINTDYVGTKKGAGKIVAGAFREELKSDVGLIQGGGLRGVFSREVVTLGDVWSVLPFENTIQVIRLTGRELTELVTRCYGKNQDTAISGVRIPVALTSKEGEERLLLIGSGESVREEKSYTVAMPTFLINGGDGVAPKERSNIIGGRNMIDSEAVQQYIGRALTRNNVTH